MVTRLFIDNYKGFVNFEWKCGPIAFLMGGNGSGKSSLFDALHALVMVISDGDIAKHFDESALFRFGSARTQRFELGVALDGRAYEYILEISWSNREGRPLVNYESLMVDKALWFVFEHGSLVAQSPRKGTPVAQQLDRDASRLKLTAELLDSSELDAFVEWAERFVLLRLVPSQVRPETRGQPSSYLYTDGSNFAAWYDSVSSADTQLLLEYLAKMQRVIPGLQSINMSRQHRGKLLEVRYRGGQATGSLTLDELSEGQISLLTHYAVLHFGAPQGLTVALDEPDNFLALAEIEPFLNELEDAVLQHGSQVFVISHHPEFYNRWALDQERCHYFERSDDGRFSVRQIDWSELPDLSPAELIARGWQDA
jgi:predicted ATPase